VNFYRKNFIKRWTAVLLVIIIALGAVGFPQTAQASTRDDEMWQQRDRELAEFGTRHHFTDFMRDHAHAVRPQAEYIIEAASYTLFGGMETRHYQDFEGMPGTSVRTEEEGYIVWEIYVAQSGLYNMSVTYFPVPGRNSDIQRAIAINGELPFFEADPVHFRRIWANARPYIQRDNQGNDLRPPQAEAPEWIETIVRDAMGTYNEPLSFYLHAGLNTISFFSQREPMMIRQIRIHQADEVLPYYIVSQGFAGLPRPGTAQVETIRIEGQDAVRRSSPMLTPQSDMSGPGVYPYSARHIRINHIGGASWSEPGSWIEWEFEVPVDGLYNIAMNVRQNFNRGALSYRRITINGEVPFYEMNAVPFDFNNGWRVQTLGGNDPFLFWLPAGTHTIRMEAVLGDYAPHVREIEDIITNLNELYRQIVMITGSSPDIFRDYEIGRRLPHLRGALAYEQARLERIFDELDQMTDGRGERDAVIRTLAHLIERLVDDIENIPRRLREFRENTGALGTWLMFVRSQELAVDAIYILPHDAPTPDNGRRWWRQLWHEIMTLIFSFIIDFNAIGSMLPPDEEAREVIVWIGTGRDQASIIKQMADELFTPESGINVTLRLIDIAMLLPATVAGIGPDVTLSIFNSLPMDYGMRGAVRDLSDFPGFDEVIQRFPEAAMVPYTFDGRVFALPETLTFPMLFYRRDILHDIGMEPPDTWDDVRAAIATLAMNHMEFGLPVGDFPHFSYGIFLYQMGGDFYNEDGSLSALDSDIALAAFRDFTRFYTDYNLPRVFDFANRFRFGDMPIAIADYTMYNMLQIFAPEIRGRWGFRPVPGTIMEDGSINRTVPSGGTAVVMMEQARDPDAAWEFMKWWTSAEIQTQFGREMETLMGAAARHPTANLEAFGMMPWPIQDYRQISAQFEWIRGIPEVPGGYFTPRQVRNAFFTSVEVRDIGPREALVDHVRQINNELRAKRSEFGIED